MAVHQCIAQEGLFAVPSSSPGLSIANLLPLVPAPPPPLVGGFMQRNPVQPRPQRRIAMEAAMAKTCDEDVLPTIGGGQGSLYAARDQRIQRLAILRDQLLERFLRSRLWSSATRAASSASTVQSALAKSAHCHARLRSTLGCVLYTLRLARGLPNVQSHINPSAEIRAENCVPPAAECSLTLLPFRHRLARFWFPEISSDFVPVLELESAPPV